MSPDPQRFHYCFTDPLWVACCTAPSWFVPKPLHGNSSAGSYPPCILSPPLCLTEWVQEDSQSWMCVCVCVRACYVVSWSWKICQQALAGEVGEMFAWSRLHRVFFSERATMATCTWLQPLFWLFQYLLVGIFGWTFSFLFIYALTIQGPAKLQDLLDNLLLSRRNGKCHYMLTGCWQQGSL